MEYQSDKKLVDELLLDELDDKLDNNVLQPEDAIPEIVIDILITPLIKTVNIRVDTSNPNSL